MRFLLFFHILGITSASFAYPQLILKVDEKNGKTPTYAKVEEPSPVAPEAGKGFEDYRMQAVASFITDKAPVNLSPTTRLSVLRHDGGAVATSRIFGTPAVLQCASRKLGEISLKELQNISKRHPLGFENHHQIVVNTESKPKPNLRRRHPANSSTVSSVSSPQREAPENHIKTKMTQSKATASEACKRYQDDEEKYKMSLIAMASALDDWIESDTRVQPWKGAVNQTLEVVKLARRLDKSKAYIDLIARQTLSSWPIRKLKSKSNCLDRSRAPGNPQPAFCVSSNDTGSNKDQNAVEEHTFIDLVQIKGLTSLQEASWAIYHWCKYAGLRTEGPNWNTMVTKLHAYFWAKGERLRAKAVKEALQSSFSSKGAVIQRRSMQPPNPATSSVQRALRVVAEHSESRIPEAQKQSSEAFEAFQRAEEEVKRTSTNRRQKFIDIYHEAQHQYPSVVRNYKLRNKDRYYAYEKLKVWHETYGKLRDTGVTMPAASHLKKHSTVPQRPWAYGTAVKGVPRSKIPHSTLHRSLHKRKPVPPDMTPEAQKPPSLTPSTSSPATTTGSSTPLFWLPAPDSFPQKSNIDLGAEKGTASRELGRPVNATSGTLRKETQPPLSGQKLDVAHKALGLVANHNYKKVMDRNKKCQANSAKILALLTEQYPGREYKYNVFDNIFGEYADAGGPMDIIRRLRAACKKIHRAIPSRVMVLRPGVYDTNELRWKVHELQKDPLR